jgi:polyhydroxyalkanoate synthase subunit PhaC
MLLSHLAACGDRRFHAASFLVTLLDASAESPMTVFAEPTLLQMAKEFAKHKGVITGQQLSQVFSWLRPNDLIWNYWANNYLLGEDPPAFDVLAWNADATRLTARLQSDIIDLVLSNGLTKPGTLLALGTPVDLTRVTCDAYVVAAMTDHISAWEGCYAATQLLGGKIDFVLSASGHIQSIVCPVDNPKARYLTNADYTPDAQVWRAAAQEHQGSWWLAYAEWLAARSDERVPAAKHLGSTAHPILAPAPGAYVLEP